MALTMKFIRGIDKPGVHGDGRGGFGLALAVRQKPDGSLRMSWTQTLRIEGKRTNIGLGSLEQVTLQEARIAAVENWQRAKEGHDPRRLLRAAHKPADGSCAHCGHHDSAAPAQAVRKPENVSGGITFAECFESYVSDKLAPQVESGRMKQKTISQGWRQPFAKYLLPSIGGMAVAAITPTDCADVLRAAIAQAPSRANDVRSKLCKVLDFAKFHGHVPANPADGVEEVLSFGYDAGTNAAPTTGEAHSQFNRVLDSEAAVMVQLLFAFTLLTASRHSESREAAWSEIDMSAKTWTIPSTRYKTKRQHRVALSAEAVRVLKRARQLAPDSELCFPSPRGRAYSKDWAPDLTRKLGANWTVHGFARKTFSDFCRETGVPVDRRQAALGRNVGENAVEQHYAGTDLLEERRPLMEAWAAHLGC